MRPNRAQYRINPTASGWAEFLSPTLVPDRSSGVDRRTVKPLSPGPHPMLDHGLLFLTKHRPFTPITRPPPPGLPVTQAERVVFRPHWVGDPTLAFRGDTRSPNRIAPLELIEGALINRRDDLHRQGRSHSRRPTILG